MSHEAMRKLIATTCFFVIVASGLFIVTQSIKLYSDYQVAQASSLGKTIADHDRLLKQLQKLQGR